MTGAAPPRRLADGLLLAGCLGLFLAPLLVAAGTLFVAARSVGYHRCLVAPEDAWSFNPFFNPWPAAILLAVPIAALVVFSRGGADRPISRLATLVGAPVGGLLLGLLLVSVLVPIGARVNAQFDASSPETFAVDVERLVVKRHKLGSSYYLLVRDWRSRGQEVLVCADGNQQGVDLSRVEPLPSEVVVTTRRGFLGLEWIERIDIEAAAVP